MKQFHNILRFLSRAVIRKYQPGIIAITGSLGKTIAKETIYSILRDVRRVRAAHHALPNDISIPLTILGSWKLKRGIVFWLRALWNGVSQLLTTHEYPELLVLEYAPDRPRGIERMMRVAPPQISVVTYMGDEPESLMHGASKLIEALPSNGYGILNYDDPRTLGMKEYTRAPIITFGFDQGADMRIVNFEERSEELPGGGYRPLGISLQLAFGEHCVPVRLDGVFGRGAAYAVAAGACVGTAFGLNLVRIAEALHYHQAPPHRLQLLPGKKGTYVFDDTNDARPASVREALETLQALPAKRVIGVFGPLTVSEEEAPDIYDMLRRLTLKTCDIIVTNGDYNQLFDSGAGKKNVIRCDTAEQAAGELQALIERGDLILVKGPGLQSIIRELSPHT